MSAFTSDAIKELIFDITDSAKLIPNRISAGVLVWMGRLVESLLIKFTLVHQCLKKWANV